MKYIIDLCVIYDANACRLQLIDNDESSIRISNPASRLLIEMLTHPNIPLKREVLIKKVWEEYGFSGSSISLNVAVSEIRKAFKLLGRETSPIKTLAKVGFCFTAMIDIYPSPQATVNETPPSAASVPLSSFPSVAESHNTPPQKQVNIRAIAAICGAFIPLLFVAALYPVEPPDQPRENLISLGKKDRCTLYSLDADKHIDDEVEKRMVNQALEESGVDCIASKADIYFSSVKHTLTYNTFLGVCYLGSQDRYTQCVTYKILNGK
ncbi:TPA: winged helix-turn-helix domain-containing protein [Serratia marcescens]|uniref:winged helix-turn-helix domain-containing protein n=1 Tax=Serratia marcescens TaxID=615 RepID=UPI001A28307A|nr:winged helix-turn-helix domain-containing protein [Serratia marcescens]HEJ7247733.1 winged helix-turn-helix domain-containing protein [Serratia marcescens]HEJ9110317.1 winged helix-turn-helix domain-containing protein [Serratia marcescens]HEJ9125802.1 winged helix-turn-helix domain-containing protein [Serratia marcescens]HEM7551406.1 winged helix-turn-helix domain-containing protein [Serratia marcescens]